MECGERHFHAKTLDEVDTYLLSKHAVKAQISVEIVNFSQASTDPHARPETRVVTRGGVPVSTSDQARETTNR